MIIKQYLPFRFSREGYIPDRIQLRFCSKTAEELEQELLDQKKSVHYHVSEEGCVTLFTPISSAANLLGPTASNSETECSAARRGILILIEGESLSDVQTEGLIRLLKGIQQEVLRIYGEPFSFCRDALLTDAPDKLPLEDLLDRGLYRKCDRILYRVQTGRYRYLKEAEDSLQRLQKAGIAGYITEVRER